MQKRTSTSSQDAPKTSKSLWENPMRKRSNFEVRVRAAIKKKHGTIAAIARAIGVESSDVFHFLAGREIKVSKSRRGMIRRFLKQEGILGRSRAQEISRCPTCGYPVMRKKAKLIMFTSSSMRGARYV